MTPDPMQLAPPWCELLDVQVDVAIGDALRARSDCPVAAAGKHKLSSGRHRRFGLTPAGILRRRL
jgi:hypothetical protein